MEPPPKPPPKNLLKPKKALNGQNNSNISFFDRSKLKKTETVVTTSFGAKPIVFSSKKKTNNKAIRVLIVSPNWLSFKYFSDNVEKKILFTPKSTKENISFEAEHSFTEIHYFDNYENNSYIEYLAVQLHSKFNFTHVICHSEEDLIRCARIREFLKLDKGNEQFHPQNVQNAERYRDKVLMKNVIKKNNPNLKLPTFKKITNGLDIFEFLKEYGFPAVVKPTKGYGSVNTTVLKKEEDVIKLLERGLGIGGLDAPIDLEIESFIQGQMYHIDGFVYKNKPIIIWPSRYTSTVVDFQENKFIGGISLSKKDPNISKLQNYIFEVIKALGKEKESQNPSCFPFHAEAWITPQDEIVLCEIASRTPGGGIKNEIFELFDFPLTENWTQGQCDDELDLDNLDFKTNLPKPNYQVGWMFPYPKIGRLRKIPRNCDLDFVLQYIPLSKNGEEFKTRSSCADAIANIVVKGKDEKEVYDNMILVYNWLFENSEWENI